MPLESVSSATDTDELRLKSATGFCSPCVILNYNGVTNLLGHKTYFVESRKIKIWAENCNCSGFSIEENY